MVLLTKLDLVCADTQKDIRHLFYSKVVEDIVLHVSTKLAIQVHDVLPLVNYGIHGRMDQDKSIQGTGNDELLDIFSN